MTDHADIDQLAEAEKVDVSQLADRIRELEDTFLPDPHHTGDYSRAERDGTIAFLLLAHAEIEWFLEQRCRYVMNTVVSAWQRDLIPRSTIVALAAFAHQHGQRNIPKEVAQQRPGILKVIKEAKRSYSSVVRLNNGISEENLAKLLIPIGITESHLSVPFIADMNALGTTRGAGAHKGVGARTPPNPADAKDRIARIMEELTKLDGTLNSLIREPVLAINGNGSE